MKNVKETVTLSLTESTQPPEFEAQLLHILPLSWTLNTIIRFRDSILYLSFFDPKPTKYDKERTQELTALNHEEFKMFLSLLAASQLLELDKEEPLSFYLPHSSIEILKALLKKYPTSDSI